MNANLQDMKAIFLEAVEKYAPDQWGPYLDQACGEDEELRHNVEVLLDAHTSGESLLDKGAIAADVTLDRPITERHGTVIDRYKLLEQIGEGHGLERSRQRHGRGLTGTPGGPDLPTEM